MKRFFAALFGANFCNKTLERISDMFLNGNVSGWPCPDTCLENMSATRFRNAVVDKLFACYFNAFLHCDSSTRFFICMFEHHRPRATAKPQMVSVPSAIAVWENIKKQRHKHISRQKIIWKAKEPRTAAQCETPTANYKSGIVTSLENMQTTQTLWSQNPTFPRKAQPKTCWRRRLQAWHQPTSNTLLPIEWLPHSEGSENKCMPSRSSLLQRCDDEPTATICARSSPCAVTKTSKLDWSEEAGSTGPAPPPNAQHDSWHFFFSKHCSNLPEAWSSVWNLNFECLSASCTSIQNLQTLTTS